MIGYYVRFIPEFYPTKEVTKQIAPNDLKWTQVNGMKYLGTYTLAHLSTGH